MQRRSDTERERSGWGRALEWVGGAFFLAAVWATAALAEESVPGVPFRAGRHFTPSSYRTIRYVVIHTIEGTAQGAIAWFRNPSSEVSAHYIVDRAGRLFQCVREKEIAWHAGNWNYNRHSIGIEHEGYADRNQWTEAQYEASARLTRAICDRYGIPKDRTHILGHVEVPGATHHDPGRYFDWDHYMELVNADIRPEVELIARDLGGRARIDMAVRNPGSARLEFEWTKLPMYDFAVRAPNGRTVYRWSSGRAFPAMKPPSRWLEPGQTARFWVA